MSFWISETRRRDDAPRVVVSFEEALETLSRSTSDFFTFHPVIHFPGKEKYLSDQMITISGRGNRKSFDHVPRSRVIVFIMDQDQQLERLFEYFVNYRDAVIV